MVKTDMWECEHCGQMFEKEKDAIKHEKNCSASAKRNKSSKITEETYDPKIHVKEYKRKCNECKTTWHSLADREDKLKNDLKSNNCDQGLAACGMCGGNWQAANMSTQVKRNEHALTEEVKRLHECPKCQSGNYTETAVYYERK